MKTGENSIQEIGLDLNPKDLQLYYSGGSDKERSKFKQRYEIKNSNQVIANIIPEDFKKVIIFNKNENELLILMVVISIILYDIANARYMRRISRDTGGAGQVYVILKIKFKYKK